ncbi:hypothetical protein E2P81_ATG02682 [Venturia nashicola]|nr:hypothetical protein E2P81_ATG02682 [Venturia nashicola]
MERLPAELIDDIADQIDDEGLKAVHQVSRILKRHTQEAFTKRFFVTRKLDTSLDCLNQLINLMRFSPFAYLVQNLIFDTVRQPDDSHLSVKIAEVMKRFAGRELNSITFVNSASATLMDAGLPPDRKHCNDSVRFRNRTRDTNSVTRQILIPMQMQGIRTRKFSVPGAWRTYAIGCSGLIFFSNFFSSLRHLDIFVYPEIVHRPEDQGALVRREASYLACFINKCPKLSNLRLGTTNDIFKSFPTRSFTNTLFSSLANLNLLETVSLTGWQDISYTTFLSFLAAAPNISRLELVEMSIHAEELQKHMGWVIVLQHLLEYKSLKQVSWQRLWAATKWEDYDWSANSALIEPPSGMISTHVDVCDKEGCVGRVHCRSGVHPRGIAKGRLAVERTFSCMLANFERMKRFDLAEEMG